MSLNIFCPYNQTPMPSQAQVTEIIILGVNHMSHQRHVRDKCSYHPICKTDRLPLASNNEQLSEMSLEIFCPYIQTPLSSPALVSEMIILGANRISLSVTYGTKDLYICPVRDALNCP